MPFAAHEHPRLLFDHAELETLRQQAQTGLRRRVLDHLRWVCADRMTPASPRYFDFRERRRDLWRLRAGIFTVLPALHALAAGYAFTGDPAIGDCARDALLAIMDYSLADAVSEAWGSRTEGWRHGPGHDKGKFNRAIAWIYDFCHDRFSLAQRAQFAAYARECIALADAWRQYDWAQMANNRGVRGVLGSTWLYLALEGEVDLPDLDARVREAERAIDTYLFLAYDTAGASYEGPGYAECLPFITSTADVLRRRGGPDLLANNRFERIPEYLAYELVPGGGLVNPLNDAHEPNGTITGGLPLLGTPRGAPLPWLARQIDLHPRRIESWLGEGPQIIGAPPAENLLYFLLWWRDDQPVHTPAELGYPTARHFQARGLASLRTGWGADDWLVSHFCGRQEYGCHQQGDQNHVSFYALGEWFLVDAGYGDRGPHEDTTAPMDRWFGETDAHNCVLIDGANQRGTNPTPGWSEGEMLDFQHTDTFDTTLGDASSCTGPDHRVRQALRRVVLVKGSPAPYLAIVDVNEKDGAPFRADALWHTARGNRLEIDGLRFQIFGQNAVCAGDVLWPPEARLSAGDSHGRPQLRVVVEAPVTETVTVFCPRRPDEPAPSFSCERLTPGTFRITCAAGQTSTLELSAATRGPLRQPLPVRLTWSAPATSC